MKKLLLVATMIAMSYGTVLAQSTVLQGQIDLDKKEAMFKGYTLLDSGGGETNYDWALTFDPETYYSGFIYHVIVYVEGCSSCDIGLYFQNTINGKVEELEPQINRAGGIVQAVYAVKQTITSKGTLSVYAKSNKKVYTYSMLFRYSY